MSTIRTDNIQSTDNSVNIPVAQITSLDQFASNAPGQGSDLIALAGTDETVTEALGQVQVQGAATWSADRAPYPINAQAYHNGKQWLALRENSVEPAEGEDWTELVGKQYVDAIFPDMVEYLQPSVTGSCTTNGTTDNTVQLTGIVTTLGLEVGDVIQIAGSTDGLNDKLFTVESITDDDNIIVNYEHAGNRGNGSLKLADQTANVTITRIAKWFSAPLGLGQAWVSMYSQRALDIDYQNLTNRPIQVLITIADNASAGSGSAYLWINGQSVAVICETNNGSAKTSATATLTHKDVYKAARDSAGQTIENWIELR